MGTKRIVRQVSFVEQRDDDKYEEDDDEDDELETKQLRVQIESVTAEWAQTNGLPDRLAIYTAADFSQNRNCQTTTMEGTKGCQSSPDEHKP